MRNWIKVKISDIGEVVGGATPSTKNEQYYNGDISWITPKDLSDFKGRFISYGERNITQQGLESCSTRLLPKNTILFSSRAPIGYVAIAEKSMCTNQGFKSVIPNENINYMFLYYLLKYNKDRIEAMGSGTTFKEVSGSTMKNVEVEIPRSITEQKNIAAILDSIDSKIENNQKINSNLFEQANTLFYNYIMEPSNFEKTGILGDYCDVKSGYAFKSAWWTKSGVKVVKIKTIENETLDLDECSYVSPDKVNYAKDFSVIAGDVLIAMTGATIGKFAIVPYLDEEILVNQRVGRFFLGDSPIEKLPFLYCSLRQKDIIADIINKGQGSAQPNISGNDILTTTCYLPTSDKIDEFNRLCKPYFETILRNQRQNINLVNIRDTLLPKLMSGEIDLSFISI